MIARIRGEHDAHWGRWRPGASREGAAATSRPTALAARDQTPIAGWRRGTRMPQRLDVRWLVVLVVAITAAYLVASGSLSPGPARSQLPATPRAWLDAYEAAAIDNPGRVCSELFAPALAQAYGNAVHGSCSSYFARITSFSVVVRRVLQDGGTAVLELRQTVRPRDWAVVLNRRRAGWQAVDLLAGDLAR
jgi:hypothetical protein